MKALFSLTTVAHKLDSILAITYPPLDLTPPILSYDPTQKSFRAAYLRSELDVLSATRDEVLGLQDKLRQIDQHLFQRQASIKFALSPLSAVPVEILQYIFRLYLPHEGDGSIDGTDEEFVRERLASSITLSHVCSSWRVVSLAMPALWNKICIDQNQTALSALARRSKNLPIDLFIKLPLSQTDAISDTPPSTRSLDLTSTGLTIQSDYSGRLSRLKLVDATTLQLGLSECEGSRMSLQSLELSSSGPLETYTLSTGMSPAANLKLEGCQISNPSQIPMYRLERISFNNSSYWNIFQTLKELRGQCPSLRNIEMMSIYEETQRRYELDNRFTLIPSYGVDSVLEVLGIANCSMGLLYDIFQEWRMPLLKTLRLVHSDEVEAEAYMAYMEDPFTTLVSPCFFFIYQVPHSLPYFFYPVVEIYLGRIFEVSHISSNLTLPHSSASSLRMP